MGIELSGIEIENFKSYIKKQYIRLSDLTVLLGANSSGKSTALQALLVLKQTMECNSPNEGLLLSGKYVALGDFDDVVSQKDKDFFSMSVLLKQTEKTENTRDDDIYKITWKFMRAEDGISAVLSSMEIDYENMKLSFIRNSEELYHILINGKRSPFSVQINNLIISEYYLHYDVEINKMAVDLLNETSMYLVSNKVPKVESNKPVTVKAIQEFYLRLLSRKQIEKGWEKHKNDKRKLLSNRLFKLISDYEKLIIPRQNSSDRMFSDELKEKVLDGAFLGVKKISPLEDIISKHEKYISDYSKVGHRVEEFKGKYCLGYSFFWNYGIEEGKEDFLTQFKYSLDFYEEFFIEILSKLFFVGPIRENPKGLYNIGFETIPKYVGPTGSYFASVLLHENKKERYYIVPEGKEEKCTLSDALAAWMIHLNVASSVNVDKKNSFGFSVSIENMEQVKSDIMNVGIGTSQVLPVLISVLLSEPKEILIFEQPELHLHPFSQSRLADMFTEFCRYGRKIILETHSEYFLLRLRYHIVKENFSNELTAVNFFENKGGTKVTFADVSGFGNINFPEDFRDETQELLNSIMEASLERKGLL